MLARYIFAEVVCIILFFVSTSNGYNYVPVINFISKAAGDGSKAQSIAICRESGGFLVTEATQSIHAEVINQVKSLGVGSEWYTFLGADTLTIDPTNCRPDSLSGTTIFDSNSVCQEREDMDEPPEDAPEWAEEQQSNVKRSKSFVSTRSFRKYDDENNDLDNVNNGDYNNNNNKVNDNNTNAFASDDNAYNHQNAAYNSNGYNGHGNGGEDGYNQRTPSKNNNRSNYNANPLFARNPSMSEPMHPQQAMQNN